MKFGPQEDSKGLVVEGGLIIREKKVTELFE